MVFLVQLWKMFTANQDSLVMMIFILSYKSFILLRQVLALCFYSSLLSARRNAGIHLKRAVWNDRTLGTWSDVPLSLFVTFVAVVSGGLRSIRCQSTSTRTQGQLIRVTCSTSREVWISTQPLTLLSLLHCTNTPHHLLTSPPPNTTTTTEKPQVHLGSWNKVTWNSIKNVN